MVLLDFGLKPYPAFVDSIVSNSLLAATCLVISNNMRYYLPRQEKYWYVLLVSLGLSAAWLVMVRVALWTLLGADTEYMALLLRSTSLRYGVAFLMVACMAMMSLLWYTQQEQKETDDRKMEAERIVKDAELFKLRQQLQPHFLFNSLNSISALTVIQPEKARHMIQQLSDFLRSSIRNDQLLWSTLSEELTYLQLYLDIEQVRFGYRLKTEITIADDTLTMKLPSMLLQPIVENAIKFGLYDTVGEVIITIQARSEKGMLRVSIQNPFDTETLPPAGTGFGLSAIQRRLYLTFARNDLLQTRHEENHFTTTVTIPQIV
ncbi:sensor histidine kinase [Segetibacter sp. 3557_3]|nr:sensor histidine kinase [Segetibacter sp. 3557_3]